MQKSINDTITMALAGSEKGKEDLCLALEPLIISSIRKYHYRPHIFEDLVQEGYIQILQGLEEYDKAEGSHFLGYIKHRLKYYYLDKNKTEKEIYSLDRLKSQGQDPLEMLGTGENLEEDLMDLLEIEKLRKAMKKLTEIEKMLLIDYYIYEKNMKEMAKERQISYRTVVNNKTRAIKKLKEMLEEKE